MAKRNRIPVVVGRTGVQSLRLSPVRAVFAVTVLFAAFSSIPLHAQFFDASAAGGPVVITPPWRFHTGDNPEWASPVFDDSQWPLLRMDRSWGLQGYSGYSGFAWYRLRLQLPQTKEPLALSLDWVGNSAEIYADGQPVWEMGRMLPEPDWYTHLPGEIVIVPVPPALNGRTIELAIRAWMSPRSAPRYAAGAAQLPQLGSAKAMEESYSLSVDQSLFRYLPDLTVMIVALVIGLSSFGLFLLRPRATEYAWAGSFLLGEATIRGWDLYRLTHPMSMMESVWGIEIARWAVFVCWLLLVWGFMRTRKGWLFGIGLLLTIFIPLATLLVNLDLVTVAGAYSIRAGAISCIGLLIFARLVHGASQGNRDAQVFLAPFLLYSVMDVVWWIRGALYFSGLSNTPFGLELYKGPHFTLTWDRLGYLLSYLAIGAVLVRRFTQSAQQEQRLATEMESARQVQAQLVPADFPRIPGVYIEAAYLPAAEVGGDFYQVFEQSGGAVLIVMGDVCGKGLKAAMTGVLAIGAARTLASQELRPGQLLARLNREMVRSQSGGFITCICALVAPDGAITLADAGHPPPYCKGQEIQVDSSLPLGVMPGVEYGETSVQLAAGDCLTLLSDGVLEARSQSGEIFGFERTREISSKAAYTIAKAAQTFGQEDDITVLTLSFNLPESAGSVEGRRQAGLAIATERR